MVSYEDICLDDVDYSDLEKQYAVELDLSTDHMMIVDQIPKLDEAKEEKFILIFKKKILGDLSATVKSDGIYIPKDPDTKMGKGFMFVEFESSDAMKKALEVVHGYQIDKSHKFVAFPFSDVDKLKTMDKADLQVVPPEAFKEKEHLCEWLDDASARDQFFAFHGDSVSIYWNEKSTPAEEAFSQKDLAEYLKWSPYGKFLATFHQQGILLWGGKSMSRFQRFSHPGVAFIDFSPMEGYLVTFSHNPIPKSEHNCFVWDVYSGKQLMALSIPVAAEKKATFWPLLKWSFDEAYVAYHDANSLYCFSAPDMKLVSGKKPVPMEGMQDLSWAPAKHHWVSFWMPEVQNTPAKVTVLELPSMKVIRTKNLFNVTQCVLYWQNQAEYLCVKVERQKTKKSTMINFEFFRLSAKDVPIDVMEVKGTCSAFAWEPLGDRFAYLENDTGKNVIHFYDMGRQSDNGLYQVKLLKSVERKNVNRLYWSPKGRFIILAGLESLSGNLEFWSLNDRSELELINSAEHYMATHLEWDPTGRYVITYQSYWNYQMENNYIIWDFKGANLRKQPLDKLKLIQWRPRPPTLLSAEKQKEVKRNLKDYSKIFDEEDAMRANQSLTAVQQLRLKLRNDWYAWRKASETEWGLDKAAIKKEKMANDQVVEEWVEEVIDEKEEILPS